MRSQYFKKATGSTTFTCNDGDKIFSAVNKALKTKEGVEIEAKIYWNFRRWNYSFRISLYLVN
ncbi:MAG: hypothetical protein Ct9H90mP3_3510 [Flammeovirgaceae bacterium]|nr:MAG: hypothetical protein Ct9H90mP3_3510 [Flammeovirgaceae bacterium]